MAITLFLFVTRLRHITDMSPEDGPCEVSEMLVISLNLVANRNSFCAMQEVCPYMGDMM